MPAAATCAHLAADHDLIGKALGLLERIAIRFALEQAVRPDAVEWVVSFLGDFADREHQQAEEDMLFPALERSAGPDELALVRELQRDHQTERARLHTMCEALGDISAPGAQARFSEAARSYVSLMRQHVQKENEHLFTLANRLLTESEDEKVSNRLAPQGSSDGAHRRERYAAALAHWSSQLGADQRSPLGAPTNTA